MGCYQFKKFFLVRNKIVLVLNELLEMNYCPTSLKSYNSKIIFIYNIEDIFFLYYTRQKSILQNDI